MNQHAGLTAKVWTVDPADAVVTSIIVRGEILFGLARLPVQASTVFSRVVCHAPDTTTAEHYSRLRLEQERLGRRLEQNDLWIAATAAQLGAIVVSRDNDMKKIHSVTVTDWTL
jgi:predicted nucleic acid-binding protein